MTKLLVINWAKPCVIYLSYLCRICVSISSIKFHQNTIKRSATWVGLRVKRRLNPARSRKVCSQWKNYWKKGKLKSYCWLIPNHLFVENRIINGTPEYFLKWKGYDNSYNTWEPVWNLNCYEMIEVFESELKDMESARQPTIDDRPPKASGENKQKSTLAEKSRQTAEVDDTLWKQSK